MVRCGIRCGMVWDDVVEEYFGPMTSCLFLATGMRLHHVGTFFSTYNTRTSGRNQILETFHKTENETLKTMDSFTFMRKQFISTYAVEVCKHLYEIDLKTCCGCRLPNTNVECLMLTEDEKIELHLDQALRNVNVLKVINRVMDNMRPFQLTIEVEAELYSWTERNPALLPETYEKIKDTVKVIRMY